MADSKLLSKIRALYAKAESTNYEAEREAFYAKVNELLERNQIELSEVLDYDDGKPKSGIVSQKFVIREKTWEPYVWKLAIINMVCRMGFCRGVFSMGSTDVVIFGKQADIDIVWELCEHIFIELQLECVKAVDAALIQRIISWKARGGNHPDGFKSVFLSEAAEVIGYRIAYLIKERKAKPGELNAIVVRNDADIEDAINNAFGKTVSRAATVSASMSRVAMMAGRAAGNRIRLEHNPELKDE